MANAPIATVDNRNKWEKDLGSMQIKPKAIFCRWLSRRQAEVGNRPWCKLRDSWNVSLHEGCCSEEQVSL